MPRNLRFRPEGAETSEKQSLLLPAEGLPMPRTLVTPDTYMPPSVTPGPMPASPAERRPANLWDGLPPSVVPLVQALMRVFSKPISTKEEPFDIWRADQIALTLAASTWLDERTPRVAGTQRFLQGRRAIIIVNHDPANPVRIRHTEQAVALGGEIAAGGSISLPISDKAAIFGQATAAGGSIISFYQFG
jgi:hypothetical protein